MGDPAAEWNKYVEKINGNIKDDKNTDGVMEHKNDTGNGAGQKRTRQTRSMSSSSSSSIGQTPPTQPPPQPGSSWGLGMGLFSRLTSSSLFGQQAANGTGSASVPSSSAASAASAASKNKTPLIDLTVDTDGTESPSASSPSLNVDSHALHMFVTQEVLPVSRLDDDDNCGICMFLLKESGMFDPDEEEEEPKTERRYGVLNKCNHRFHSACLSELMSKTPTYVQCPVCKVIYGVKHGTQPKAGTMNSRILKTPLAGYEADQECQGTIEIMYNFHMGVQEEGHPSPGQPYNVVAFPRVAYLPATPKGHTVHKLLERAFKQRVTFTIGTSSTSGLSNVITWNDIHHKTQLNGPYGYPDEFYLDRVLLELAQHGIFQ